MKFTIVLAIFIFVLQLSLYQTEYFSSTSGLEQLLRTEVILLSELQKYVNEIKEHADVLQSEIDAIELEHGSATDSMEGYLNNPVNAFRLIKRLHSDWSAYEYSVQDDRSRSNFLKAMEGHRENLSYPTQADFEGTAVAMTRLQQTYQLDVGELASGMLHGIKYGASMSWQDCFALGHHLYERHEYNHTVPWLQQSMKLLEQQSYGEDPASLDFMEAVVGYHTAMGDHQNALNLINHVLKVQPEQRLHLLQTRVQLEQLIADGVKRGLMYEVQRAPGDYHSTQEYKTYQQVCRGTLLPQPATQRALRCRLFSGVQHSSILQPYKLEELHLDPYIIQVHDVVSAEQAVQLQNQARPRLERSQVYGGSGSKHVSATFRTSKGTTFDYADHEVMWSLRRHLIEITGLNMQSAEALQIANYGIGGHYEPHMDTFADNYDFSQDIFVTDRIATGIFYLSHVEAGGGTAFPYLPLLVKPEQGSLLFWHNMHRSGEKDYRTKHAGCPVLQGSKWIANAWIRYENQDHIRPCDLQPDDEVSRVYKDYS